MIRPEVLSDFIIDLLSEPGAQVTGSVAG